jgi:hypothetical protein
VERLYRNGVEVETNCEGQERTVKYGTEAKEQNDQVEERRTAEDRGLNSTELQS